NTWYSEALAEKIAGIVLDPNHDINAQFNSNLGQAGCFTGTFFYLGFDNNHGNSVDLISVLLHEFAHGLGFQTFTSNTSGAPLSGFPSIFDRFLMDVGNGKSWLQMTNAERQASAINTHKLGWNGPLVLADVPSVLQFGVPIVAVTSPAGIAGNYDAGTASFGPLPTAGGVTGPFLLANDGTAPTTDGCEAFPAGFFNGQIAVIDRGTCSFKAKALNAQNAGATAVIIINNVAGSPAPGLGDDATIVTPIVIPTVSLTLPDGNTIKAQLGSGVNGAVKLDLSQRAGTDPFDKALLNAPDPVVSGSSVSHWDTIDLPNQLMEPSINGDLTHNVTPPSDLTFSELRDTGWVANALPNTITATAGNSQSTNTNTQFPTLFKVTVSPAVAGLRVTFTSNNSGGGANGTFATTGSRIAVANTDGSGVATAPAFTANGVAGTYTMNITVPGAGTTPFTLTNTTGPLLLTSAVSRKTHTGIAMPFDVPLPMSSPFGVECRTGGGTGNHTLVFTFANPVVSGNASVTAGAGSVAGSPVFSGNTMTVNLTGVTDVQLVTVTLTGVTDSSAQVLPNTPFSVKFLAGDTTGSSSVNGTDVSLTKSESGNAVNATNFRSDVNLSGGINGSDVSAVKAATGHTL
ncbi:MAG TPA: PA domain-containing protein, partial [Chthoniobacterales bacterium]|nr:PA domain-containing protein [Chthoniobacterales bacterium]